MKMLTHRQGWRRQSRGISRGRERDSLYVHEHSNADQMTHPSKAQPLLRQTERIIGLKSEFRTDMKTQRDIEAARDFVDDLNVRHERKITWKRGVRVVLIPCRQEYFSTDLADQLWWREVDYERFQIAAYQEISETMQLYGVSEQTATLLLYSNCDNDNDENQEHGLESSDSHHTNEYVPDIIPNHLKRRVKQDYIALSADAVAPLNSYIYNQRDRVEMTASSAASLFCPSELCYKFGTHWNRCKCFECMQMNQCGLSNDAMANKLEPASIKAIDRSSEQVFPGAYELIMHTSEHSAGLPMF